MVSDPAGSILLLILFLLGGAIVRAAEAALSMVNDEQLEQQAEKGSPRARRIALLAQWSKERFGRLTCAFAVMLTGFALCAYVRLFPVFLKWLSGIGAEGLREAIAALLLLILCAGTYYAFAGLVPSWAAKNGPEKALGRVLTPAYALCGLCFPLYKVARGIAVAALMPFRIKPNGDRGRVTEEQIRMLVDIGEEKGAIEADEKEMIENVFEFNNMTAEDCMVHRKDITFIDVEDSAEEVLKTIQDSGLSRFPVYEENMDNIVGILTARDYLLNACFERGKALRELIRPAYFVPESVRADKLFSEMQKRKQHMAIVLDEYGGTSGLITLEDLLEEIVGNIYDEFDPQVEQEIIPLGENRWRVSGSVELDALLEIVGVPEETEEECETLGGLVFSRLAEIPSDGEKPVVECLGMRVSVEEIRERRVEWAIVEKIQMEKPTA